MACCLPDGDSPDSYLLSFGMPARGGLPLKRHKVVRNYNVAKAFAIGGAVEPAYLCFLVEM